MNVFTKFHGKPSNYLDILLITVYGDLMVVLNIKVTMTRISTSLSIGTMNVFTKYHSFQYTTLLLRLKIPKLYLKHHSPFFILQTDMSDMSFRDKKDQTQVVCLPMWPLCYCIPNENRAEGNKPRQFKNNIYIS